MNDLPACITQRLQAVALDNRAPAYLQIDGGLRLVGAGGDLASYGLAGLRLGEPAADQVPFLEGLLPLSDAPHLLPSVELANGRAADLHFDRDGTAVSVLLLDVTAEREAARRVQQKAYDITLVEEREAALNR